MKVFDGSWKAFLARTLVFGMVAFGAVKLAVADPGGPASPNSLTYSGLLRNLAGTGPVSGPVTLSFTLRRADGAACPPVMVSTTASASGAFSEPVSTSGCPSGFFNGDEIRYDVSLVSPPSEVGQLTPDGGVVISSVPYARYADKASSALRAEAASGALLSQLNAVSHTRTRTGDEIRPQLDLPVSAAELGGAGHTVLLSVTAVGPSLDIKRLYVVYISSSANFGACFSELGPGARFSPGGDVSVLSPILDATPMTPVRVVCNGIFFPGSGRPDDALAGVVIRFERMPSSGWHWQYSTHTLN